MRLLFVFLLMCSRPAWAEPKVSIRARSFQPGEAVLVAVSGHSASTAPAGSFGGAALNFFTAGRKGSYLALAGLDLEVSTGPRRLALELADEQGRTGHWSRELRVKAKKFPMQRLMVEPQYVAPKPEEAARAEEEARKLRAILSAVTPRRFFSGNFRLPIAATSSARFGERRVFNGVPKAPHGGADLRAKAGVPVHACGEGKVVLAAELFYLGRTVILDHGYGLYSIYGHLSETLVKEGDVAQTGQVLGKVGATGRATGPHLHWAVKAGGSRVDPFSLTAMNFSTWLGR